ncbi:DUF6471 domain-containing protein [Brevundimonas sp. UBA7534]|uniref:DUF6471 domain-containing protein n=1 Tax=Brevundimonas sp. UBA7534 TaxID=1946138 RepID=UPI0025B866DE|nr:DUF6471 domain-containing protein [Brevundimonas sp. UBA7534]
MADESGEFVDDFDPKANAAAMDAAGLSVAKGLLKAEMAKRRLTYEGLANLMWDHGIEENERNLRNKVSRGGFSAAWFFAVMMMMEVKMLDMSHSYETVSDYLNRPAT